MIKVNKMNMSFIRAVCVWHYMLAILYYDIKSDANLIDQSGCFCFNVFVFLPFDHYECDHVECGLKSDLKHSSNKDKVSSSSAANMIN